MNETNLNAWLTDLRTTDAPQIEGYLTLRGIGQDRLGYCCLGRGEVVRGAVAEQIHIAGTMATREFIDWLGLDMHDHDQQYHVELGEDIDCGCAFDLLIEMPSIYQNLRNQPYAPTASSLNDDKFTFAQIADVIDYFGIDRVISQ